MTIHATTLARAARLALVAVLLASASPAHSAFVPAPLRVAVGQVRGSPDVRAIVLLEIQRRDDVAVLDPGLVDAALAGSGYDGSLNLTRSEARRLAQVCGVEVLVLAVASIVDLGPEAGPDSWDARAGVFVVDGRTGELVHYATLTARGADRPAALRQLSGACRLDIAGWTPTLERIRAGRTAANPVVADAPVLDLVANPETAPGESPPRFFRRPHPALTADAERFRVSATVDVVVEFKADGTFGTIDVVRWAGFGLDEACIAAIRAEKFFAARRAGHGVDSRALLRFNFTFDDK